MYKGETKGVEKAYCTPILPTLVNAYARCYMYKYYKKIPLKNLVYTDTDSIIWQGKEEELKKMNIGEEMGQFKIKDTNTTAIIYGRKSKSIGEDISVAGVHKKNLIKEEFEKGYVTDTKIIGIGTEEELKKMNLVS